MKPTAKITIELTFEISQLTLGELKLAVEQTLSGFVEQNVDLVSLTNEQTGELYGAHLEAYEVKEGPR